MCACDRCNRSCRHGAQASPATLPGAAAPLPAMPRSGHFKNYVGGTVGEACSTHGKPGCCFSTLISWDRMGNAPPEPQLTHLLASGDEGAAP